MSTIGFEDHDHRLCIAGAMAAIEARCAGDGLKLTPVRRRVLEILLDHHRAVGAYEILDGLRQDGLGSQPPVAYRALDFLVRHGFAHRVERLNAFIACAHPAEEHMPAFLICRICDAVAEAPSGPSRRAFDRTAREAGFAIERAVLEAEGICPECSRDDGP